MVSMSDVAKKAGVGVSTVSKVINNYKNISNETRKRVMDAVEELNYVPNAVASALSSKSSRRVALVVFINNQRQAIDEINMQYLFGAVNQAKLKKLEVLTVFSTDLDGMNSMEIKQHFASLRIQAVILYGLSKENKEFHDIIEEDVYPCVVVDAPLIGPKTSYVTINHRQAQRDMINHMAKLHKPKKILYLAGRLDGYVTDFRLQGAVDACLALNIEMDAQYANFSEKEAIAKTKQFAESCDIIVCASDLMAIGAVSALNEMGLFKPVCGYDGITLLGYIDYRIVTVKQDFYDISIKAIDAVIKLLNGEKGSGLVVGHQIMTIGYEDVIM